MFFSSDILIADVVKTIRESDPIKQCSLLLQEELQKFDFSIDNSFKSAKDIFFSYKIYQDSFLPHWKNLPNSYLASEKT